MKKFVGIFVMTLLMGAIASQVSACTGFTYNDENNVFACHNEDYTDYIFNIRFFPTSEGKYGRMYFEVLMPDEDGSLMMIPFSGMNDQGCFFSAYGTPYLKPINSRDKPFFTDPDGYYNNQIQEHCLAECSTIEEIIEMCNDYNLEGWADYQILIADSTGNSAIIEGDDIIYKEGDFQVVSNFLHSHPERGDLANGFERYNTAVSMLENMTEPSVESFTDICNATHIDTPNFWTVHSMICDLENQIIYLYFYHNYEKMVTIDLNEELEKGEHSYYIGSLFEPDGNLGPGKPEAPTGNESGLPGEIYRYSVRKLNDPDGDTLSYMWDWGDGNYSHWFLTPRTGAYTSAEHNWNKEGTYEVRVKARDIYGAESEWSEPLVVSMPKTKSIDNFNPWLLRLIQRFPILELLLNTC